MSEQRIPPEEPPSIIATRRDWLLVAGLFLLILIVVWMFWDRGGPESAEAGEPAEVSSVITPATGRTTHTHRVEGEDRWNEMYVTATAYNSLRAQTDDDPSIAAWGDKLEPGMKAIAVSRDLLAMGLTHDVKVWIEGHGGPYLVLDKMNKRWKDRIDVYMGVDKKKALEWGKKRVKIRWRTSAEDPVPGA